MASREPPSPGGGSQLDGEGVRDELLAASLTDGDGGGAAGKEGEALTAAAAQGEQPHHAHSCFSKWGVGAVSCLGGWAGLSLDARQLRWLSDEEGETEEHPPARTVLCA